MAKRGYFILTDISGSTEFLTKSELDHAQDILADLMGTIVTALRPSFRLAKLVRDYREVTNAQAQHVGDPESRVNAHHEQ